jgi:acyl carrier protein
MTINDALAHHEVRTAHSHATDGLVIPAEEAARTAQYENVLSRLRKLLIEQLHIRREPDEIDPDAVLFGTGLGLDSVDAVELTVALESEFGVKFPDDESSRRVFRTVNSVVDHLLKAKGAANVS